MTFKKLVVGDSMLRDHEVDKDTLIVVLRGKTMCDIAKYIEDNPNTVRKYDTFTAHAGTNSIRRLSVPQFKVEYKNVAQKYFQVNPKGVLGFSCILPRPRDHEYTGWKVKQVNKWLESWCKANGFMCIRGYTQFLHCAKPIGNLFCDRLHLNQDGVEVFKQFWRSELSDASIFRHKKSM